MPERTTGGSGWAVTRYVVAATLVRSADGGAVDAIVLLAHASGHGGLGGGSAGCGGPRSAPHVGAGSVLLLPRQDPPADPGAVPSPVRTLGTIVRSGPLRRTLALPCVVAFSVAALPLSAVALAPSLGDAALAGALVAGYGVGNLGGSAALMVRPLRGDADLLTRVLAGVVAVALAVLIPLPGLVASIVVFAVAGVAHGHFFAATLAARSEYAPLEARGQVFIWVGALKTAAGSAGTAVAGALVGGIGWAPVGAVAALTGLAAPVCGLERLRR